LNQRLIRFDIRLPKSNYVNDRWKKEDRNRFLLRSDVEWPLSSDPLVWPSIFFSKIFRDSTGFPYGNIEVDPVIDGGNYWLSLDQMGAHYKAHRSPYANGVFIAIHLFSENPLTSNFIAYSRDGIQFGLELGDATPSDCPSNSEFLGYDVGDASWISGLSNCEYTATERKRLEPIWRHRLNSFGLLSTLDDAAEFRKLSDDRVSEHAPFWIYGISKLSA
jgi:hypothetical protein